MWVLVLGIGSGSGKRSVGVISVDGTMKKCVVCGELFLALEGFNVKACRDCRILLKRV